MALKEGRIPNGEPTIKPTALFIDKKKSVQRARKPSEYTWGWDITVQKNDKHHKSTSSLAGVLLDGSHSERKLLVKAPNLEDKFQFAETRCSELQEKLSDLINNSKKRKNLKKRSATGLNTVGKMSDLNDEYVTIRRKNPKRGCDESPLLCEWDNETTDVPTSQKSLEKPREYTADYVTVRRKNRKKQNEEEALYFDYANQAAYYENNGPNDPNNPTKTSKDCSDSTQTRRRNSKTKQGKEDSSLVDKDLDMPHCSYAITPENTGQKGDSSKNTAKSSRHSVTYKTRRRSGDDINQNTKRPVVELYNINRSESSNDSWQENYSATQKKHGGDAYAIIQETSIAPVVESNTESEDEVAKRNKKIRKVLKYMVRRRYELPTVASRSKQRSTKAYEPSTNQAHIPFVTSKSATPSHNVGLNIQQVLHGVKVNQPISEIPSTIAHHMGLRHCASEAGVDNTKEVWVKELNTLQLGKTVLTLPKYKSMSFEQLLKLYQKHNVIVGKYLSTASCRKKRPSLKRMNPSKALTFKCPTEDSDDLMEQQSFSSRPQR